MKFCINCGTQIPDAAKFCPSCGFKQPAPATNNGGSPATPASASVEPTKAEPMTPVAGNDDSSVQSTSTTVATGNQESQQPATAANAQTQPTTSTTGHVGSVVGATRSAGEQSTSQSQSDTTGADDVDQRVNADNVGKTAVDMVQSQIYFGPLTKDAAVVEHKVSLGYSNRMDNYVLASTPISWSEILTTLRGLLGLRSKTYIMAFEDGGVLLMGALGMQKFTGDDVFIESSRISDIQLEHYPLAPWDHMFLTIDGEVLELLVATRSAYGKAMWFSIPWHLRNAPKMLKYTK